MLVASGSAMGVKTPARRANPREVVPSDHIPTMPPAVLIPAAAVAVDPGVIDSRKNAAAADEPVFDAAGEVVTEDLPHFVDTDGLGTSSAREVDITEGAAVFGKAAHNPAQIIVYAHDQPGAVDARGDACSRAWYKQDLVDPVLEGECCRR